MFGIRLLALCLGALTLSFALLAHGAQAQDRAVPYWASIRVDQANMRVGPGEQFPIKFVYRRVHLPLKVLRIREGWRLVEDPDGAQGWMLGTFLSRSRGAIVIGNGLVDMREAADANSRLLWRLKAGVTGNLGTCTANWCEFAVGQRSGHVRQDRLWGVGAP